MIKLFEKQIERREAVRDKELAATSVWVWR